MGQTRTLLLAIALSVCAGTACSDEMAAHPDNYVGIGAELTMDAAGARVVRVLEGSPAGPAGLARGDVILTLDGDPTRGKSLAEVVSHIRGKPGTTIRMLVRTADGERELAIKRAAIQNR